MCASGMKSVMYGAQGIMLGQAETILTGVRKRKIKKKGI
jgi:acetyl-CoA acetyltransferase